MTTDPFGEIIEYNAPLYIYLVLLLLAESRIHMSFLAQKRKDFLNSPLLAELNDYVTPQVIFEGIESHDRVNVIAIFSIFILKYLVN